MRLKIGKKLSISERRPLSFTSKTSLFPLHQKTHNILTGNLLWSSRVLIITTTDDGSFQYPAFYLPLPSDNEHILTYFVIYCECCLAPSSVKWVVTIKLRLARIKNTEERATSSRRGRKKEIDVHHALVLFASRRLWSRVRCAQLRKLEEDNNNNNP